MSKAAPGKEKEKKQGREAFSKRGIFAFCLYAIKAVLNNHVESSKTLQGQLKLNA